MQVGVRVGQKGIIFTDTSTYDPPKAFKGTSGNELSPFSTGDLFSALESAGPERDPATALVSPRGSQVQSWHLKSCTTEKGKLPGLLGSDRNSSSPNCWGRKGSGPVMGEPSGLQPRHIPQAAGPHTTFIPPPHILAVPPWGETWRQECKGSDKSGWDQLVQASDLSFYPWRSQ